MTYRPLSNEEINLVNCAPTSQYPDCRIVDSDDLLALLEQARRANGLVRGLKSYIAEGGDREIEMTYAESRCWDEVLTCLAALEGEEP